MLLLLLLNMANWLGFAPTLALWAVIVVIISGIFIEQVDAQANVESCGGSIHSGFQHLNYDTSENQSFKNQSFKLNTSEIRQIRD
jgi:hypothetical protein